MKKAKKAVKKVMLRAAPKRPAVAKVTTVHPLAARRGTAADSMVALMAQAYALEIEASERYGEMADTMAEHNNREVAELFRKLSRIEHRHAEQILEKMGWVEAPAPPAGGWRWEALEGPETADASELHYLMEPYHALQLARKNEARAQAFFEGLVRRAPAGELRAAAREFAEEETEHVRLIDEWLARTPKPARDWHEDPDPPRHVE